MLPKKSPRSSEREGTTARHYIYICKRAKRGRYECFKEQQSRLSKKMVREIDYGERGDKKWNKERGRWVLTHKL